MVRPMRLLAIALLSLGLATTVATGATSRPTAVRALALEQELRGELNRVRAEHGLRPLLVSRGLQAAALAHSHAMVAAGFFDHASRDGTAMADRVRRSYPPGAGAWSVGENLIWAGPRLGARQAIRSWLGSPGHRRNVLAAGWREVGIGAVRATGAGGVYGRGSVVVITMDFGAR